MLSMGILTLLSKKRAGSIRERSAKTDEIRKGSLPPEKAKMAKVIFKYKEVLGKMIPGGAKGAIHTIDLINETPARTRYKWSEQEKNRKANQWLLDHVPEWIQEGLIEETQSKWHYTMATAPAKKDEEGKLTQFRLCVDYRALNKITRKDPYRMPKVDDCLKMRKGRYFTKMDLKNGFWQIPLRKEDRQKTTFIIGDKYYQWKVMPMGMKNSPMTFQALIDKTLAGITGEYVGYIDDIIIFSETWQEHFEHLGEVLRRLQKTNLRVSIQKCEWATKSVRFLGHIFSHREIKIDPEKIQAVDQLQYPDYKTPTENIKSLQKILGMTRRYIPNYARIAKPLHSLLKAGVEWKFGEAQKEAWDGLKKALRSSPVLKQADPEKEFFIETDASRKGLGAVLLQFGEDGYLHPLAYLSRALKKAEELYPIRELEAVAIYWACLKFRDWIIQKKFYVITDHASLATSANKGESPRIQQWLERLELEFEFEILYRAGAKNKVADCLSREIASQVEERKKKIILLPVNEWVPVARPGKNIEVADQQESASQLPDSQALTQPPTGEDKKRRAYHLQ